MGKRDYYTVLGLSRSCSSLDIKTAYRKLARLYHPDRNPGVPQAEENFKELAEAYEVLSDPTRRAHYDATGMDSSSTASIDPYEVFRAFFSEDSVLSPFLGRSFQSAYGSEFAGVGVSPDALRCPYTATSYSDSSTPTASYSTIRSYRNGVVRVEKRIGSTIVEISVNGRVIFKLPTPSESSVVQQ